MGGRWVGGWRVEGGCKHASHPSEGTGKARQVSAKMRRRCVDDFIRVRGRCCLPAGEWCKASINDLSEGAGARGGRQEERSRQENGGKGFVCGSGGGRRACLFVCVRAGERSSGTSPTHLPIHHSSMNSVCGGGSGGVVRQPSLADLKKPTFAACLY